MKDTDKETMTDTEKEVEELAEVAGVSKEKMARMIQFAGEGWNSEDTDS